MHAKYIWNYPVYVIDKHHKHMTYRKMATIKSQHALYVCKNWTWHKQKKKSCTTWDVQNLVKNGINYLSTGAGFLPSTVVDWFRRPLFLFVAPRAARSLMEFQAIITITVDLYIPKGSMYGIFTYIILP